MWTICKNFIYYYKCFIIVRLWIYVCIVLDYAILYPVVAYANPIKEFELEIWIKVIFFYYSFFCEIQFFFCLLHWESSHFALRSFNVCICVHVITGEKTVNVLKNVIKSWGSTCHACSHIFGYQRKLVQKFIFYSKNDLNSSFLGAGRPKWPDNQTCPVNTEVSQPMVFSIKYDPISGNF